jgi:hypothetical protein
MGRASPPGGPSRPLPGLGRFLCQLSANLPAISSCGRTDAELGMARLDQDQLAYLATEIEKRRHGHVSDLPDLVHRELVPSTAKLGQPDWPDLHGNVSLVLGQPEMLQMWARWHTPRTPGNRD